MMKYVRALRAPARIPLAGDTMNTVRFKCPSCRKEVEATQPEVTRPVGTRKDDPLLLIRATCPECGRVIQMSRLR
jgi:endogenous inhibitor of DNA gyrase (YacG/DUF329 family)